MHYRIDTSVLLHSRNKRILPLFLVQPKMHYFLLLVVDVSFVVPGHHLAVVVCPCRVLLRSSASAASESRLPSAVVQLRVLRTYTCCLAPAAEFESIVGTQCHPSVND